MVNCNQMITLLDALQSHKHGTVKCWVTNIHKVFVIGCQLIVPVPFTCVSAKAVCTSATQLL